MTDPIRILMVSDLHFGSSKMDQVEMAENFASVIFPLLSETDIFFINGDFFDHIVMFDNFGFDPIYEVIMSLFAKCEENNVTLRLLQGTWSHDRNQCRRFLPFYKKGKFSFDFRYIPNIEIEEIAIRDRAIRVFYIPDNMPATCSDDLAVIVDAKRREKGWDYIDYGCMHGFFDFTVPEVAAAKTKIVFKSSQFPFIKKMIDVGHVHQNATDGNVISNGSFDRLCHGEEDPKGLIRVLDYPDHYVAQFVENPNPAIFDTIFVDKEDSTVELSAKIKEHLAKIKTNRQISLRVVTEKLELREAIRAWMRQDYPDVVLSFKAPKDVKDTKGSQPPSLLVLTVEHHEAPTPQTLASCIRSHIEGDYPLSIEDIQSRLDALNKS